jgi:SAM-dependent methyltransferase
LPHHWLLVRGRGDRPLEARGFTLERHSSSKRPSLAVGDLAICYASVWQAVFAVVEVVSPPEEDPERDRWRWSFGIRPLIALGDLEHAVPSEEVGVFPSSIWRHSYIRLTPATFERARHAVATAVVRAGYDEIAPRYGEWAASFESPVRAWVARLLERLDAGSRVLDLGCGNGSIVARALVDAGHDVVGVDVSRAQLRLAARNVPELQRVLGDALEVELPPESFDAVVSTFVFGHVTRAQQPALLERIHGWLRPGGRALLTMGVGESEDVVVDDWLGAPMLFASFDAETNLELVRAAGFEVEDGKVVPFEEPGHGRVSFQWLLLTKRRQPGAGAGAGHRSASAAEPRNVEAGS